MWVRLKILVNRGEQPFGKEEGYGWRRRKVGVES